MQEKSVITTAAGMSIGDNQNSVIPGLRGPLLVQDWQLFEKHAFQPQAHPRTCRARLGLGGLWQAPDHRRRQPLYQGASLAAGVQSECFLRFSRVAAAALPPQALTITLPKLDRRFRRHRYQGRNWIFHIAPYAAQPACMQWRKTISGSHMPTDVERQAKWRLSHGKVRRPLAADLVAGLPSYRKNQSRRTGRIGGKNKGTLPQTRGYHYRLARQARRFNPLDCRRLHGVQASCTHPRKPHSQHSS
jgi:hypothetical protein